jgi:hypothetical protein
LLLDLSILSSCCGIPTGYPLNRQLRNGKKDINKKQRLLFMLSEKSYWIILILSFTIFALSIWIFLIPYHILEYSLGVGFFTSAIFMVLTIVFLSWLFNLRETRQWEHVKKRVLKLLGLELTSLARFFMMMFHETINKPLWSSDKAFLDTLEELNNQSKLNVSDTWISMLSSGEFAGIFEDYEKRLSDIEDRYFRFLDYRLVDSLMEIRWNLISFTVDFNTYKQIYRADKEIARQLLKENFEKYAEGIHRIIKEIYVMHKLGLNISTTQKLLERKVA